MIYKVGMKFKCIKLCEGFIRPGIIYKIIEIDINTYDNNKLRIFFKGDKNKGWLGINDIPKYFIYINTCRTILPLP